MIIGEFEQQPWERLDYDVTFEDWLTPGDNLDSVELSVSPAGPTLTQVLSDPRVKVWVEGVADGVKYKVTVKGGTADGRQKEIEFTVKGKDH